MNLCLRKNSDEILDTPISQLNNLVKTTQIKIGTSCGNGYCSITSSLDVGHAKCRCYTGWTSYSLSRYSSSRYSLSRYSLSGLDTTSNECQVQVSNSCPRNLCDTNADCIRSAQLLDLEGVKNQFKSTNGYSCVCKTGYHLPEENTILPMDGSVCLKNTLLDEKNSKKVHFTKDLNVEVSRYEEFSDFTSKVYHFENFLKIGDREYTNWYVSDNGVFILFNGENTFGNVFSKNMPSFYDNSELVGKNFQIIAPYWHDFDPYTLNNVTSITVSVDSYESKMLVSRECGMDVRPVRFSVVVTWRRMSNFPKVERYDPKNEQADNTFQLVLATDGVDTCAVFNYSAFFL